MLDNAKRPHDNFHLQAEKGWPGAGWRTPLRVQAFPRPRGEMAVPAPVGESRAFGWGTIVNRPTGTRWAYVLAGAVLALRADVARHAVAQEASKDVLLITAFRSPTETQIFRVHGDGSG